MRNIKVSCIALGAVLLGLCLRPGFAETQEGSDLVTDSFRGVVTDSADRPAVINAYRTDDLSASDTFSGTVTAEGVDRARLEGLVYQVVQRTPSGSELVVAEAPVSTGTFKGVVSPGGGAAGAGSLFGRLSRNGQELARGTNTAVQPQQVTPHIPPTSGAVRIPEIQQANKSIGVLCPGVCDGNLETTSFKLGGQDVPLLAESPRKVVAAPTKVTGATTAEFRKKVGNQEVVETGQCRQVGVGITATSRNLRRDQHASLTVTFTGLQGVKNPIPAVVRNLTPQVVELQGGNEQAFLISPESVTQNGTVGRSMRLTGVQAGEFDLTASVLHVYGTPANALDQAAPPCKDAVDMGIVATTTDCPNGKVVFVDTHKWWCPPDGHTETSVVRTETDSPCSPVNAPQSTSGNIPLGGPALMTTDFKGKGGDRLKDTYTRGFADPNINVCKQQNCGDPQEITEAKDKGKIYCKKIDECGGKQCPKTSCHVFTAWIDGTKGPGGKDRKDAKEANEKWTQFGQDTKGIGDLTGIGKENAIPRNADYAYACVCK